MVGNLGYKVSETAERFPDFVPLAHLSDMLFVQGVIHSNVQGEL
jgi:hypothetical protein